MTLFFVFCFLFSFFNFTKAKAAKEKKINKWVYTKWNSFCTAKETVNKKEWQPTECEKAFANHLSDKMLLSKIFEQLLQLSGKKKKSNGSNLKWAEALNRHLSKEGKQIDNRYMKWAQLHESSGKYTSKLQWDIT